MELVKSKAMKKTIFIFLVFVVTFILSGKCLAYWSGDVYSPQWPDGYQETKQYYAGGSYVHYYMYVDHGAAYIGHDGGLNDSLYNNNGDDEKWGYYEGSWLYITMTACNLQNEEGYAFVIAYL